MQLYELKTIQSEDDLPKEEGLYVVQLTSWNKNERSVISYDGSNKDRMGWLKNVQAYFSPVSVKKETVSDAVEFKEWCDANHVNLDYQEQHNHTAKELYHFFKINQKY